MVDPVFTKFQHWAGYCEEGTTRDFLGVSTRQSYRNYVHGRFEGGWCEPELPPINEDLIGWVDLLNAVLDSSDLFTMFELGAGWGAWAARGATAAKSLGKRVRLVGVEAEPSHYEMMADHLSRNRLVPEEYQLIQAAVSGTEGEVPFFVGHAEEWYGQCIAPDFDARAQRDYSEASVARVRSISLASILEDFERVDLIDMDVQGAEFDVLDAAAEALERRVRCVHVGTHNESVENALRDLFGTLGWECRHDYGCRGSHETPYGTIKFNDGVQTWLNPRLVVGG